MDIILSHKYELEIRFLLNSAYGVGALELGVT